MKKLLTILVLLSTQQCFAAEFFLKKKNSIQKTIDASSDGDVINLAAGVYKQNFNFKGKAITLRGSGRNTVIKGTKFKAAITMNEDEGHDTIIENITFKKGLRSGVINLDRAAPTIRNCYFFKNKARSDGTTIMIFQKNSASESPIITNNVFYKNKVRSAKPGNIAQTIFMTSSAPLISNNTFIANDRSAIYIRGLSAPIITNNIFAYMGTIKAPERKKVDDFSEKEPRGRAIYIENLETDSDIQISYNISFANKVNDVYIQGSDFSFADLQANPVSFINLENNLTVDPNLSGVRLNKKATKVKKLFNVELSPLSPAINAGNPETQFNDLDTTRNDIGATGGLKPFNFNRL